MIKKPPLVVVLLAGVLLKAGPALSQGVEKALNDQYRDRVLVFRNPLETLVQEYDSEGKILSSPSTGSWARDGGMLVKKILLSADKLKLEGQRAFYRFDERNGHFTSAHGGEVVKVTIRLNTPLASVDQASLVLARVFALTDDEKRHLIPSDWMPGSSADPPSGGNTKGTGLQSEKVFHISDGVTPPQPLSKQEPGFSSGARNETFPGTVGLSVVGTVGLNVVVDSAGHVRYLKIVHSLDKVLDEKAVDAVKEWRFKPGMKDGVPVSVAVYIEIDFH